MKIFILIFNFFVLIAIASMVCWAFAGWENFDLAFIGAVTGDYLAFKHSSKKE